MRDRGQDGVVTADAPAAREDRSHDDVPLIDRGVAVPAQEPRIAQQRAGASSRPFGRLLLAALVAGVITLIGALVFGHGIETKPPGEIPWAGKGTAWGLPVARFLHDAAAVVTVGFLLLATALLPDRKGTTGPSARAAHRIARVSAGVWVLAVAAEALLTLSQDAAAPLGRVLHGSTIRFYLLHVTEGTTFLVVAVIALLVLLIPTMSSVNTTAVVLGLSVAGLILPPVLTGHSASAGHHDAAMTSLMFHVLAAALWVGGLAAVSWLAFRRSKASGRPIKGLAVALPRFSSLALVCFVTIAVSGTINAWIRVGTFGELFGSRYGQLVLLKVTALVVLGVIGYSHRRATLPAAVNGERRAFLRLAAGELVVMAVAVGLAVALSRSPTPVARSDANVSAAKAILGYDMPGPISVKNLAFDWAPQLLLAVFCVAGAVLYAMGVHRLRARGDKWPRIYSAAWYSGLAVVAITTVTGVNRYGMVLFSVHMAQHMLLSMFAPPLLALGAPVTLALRYFPARSGVADARGPRAWLLSALRSPVLRVLSHPVVSLSIFIASTFGLYFSSLFQTLMENHAGHVLMSVHFLVTGCLLFWPMVSPDPLPHRPGHGARMFELIILVPFHAFFGLAIMTDTHVIAASYYEKLHRTWGASLLSDQHTAGGIAMALAEPMAFLVAGVILMQWSRADARTAKAIDRRGDLNPENDDLANYNRYLAGLAKRG